MILNFDLGTCSHECRSSWGEFTVNSNASDQESSYLASLIAVLVTTVTTLLYADSRADEVSAQSSRSEGVEFAVAACKTSLTAVHLYEASFEVSRPISPVPTGSKFASNGEVLFQRFDRAWDTNGCRDMVRGEELLVQSGQAYYRPFWGVFDGEKLYSYGESLNGGQIKPYENELTAYWHLDSLLGYGDIHHPERDLSDLLDGPRRIIRADDVEGIYEVEMEYFELHRDRLKHIARIEIDALHGYLPRRIEYYFCGRQGGVPEFQCLSRSVVIIDFTEYTKGFWVPSCGIISEFSMRGVYPKGMTSSGQFEQNDLDENEKDELLRKIRYEPVPMVEPTTVRVVPASLVMNERIDDEKFKLEFPQGAGVYDDFSKKFSGPTVIRRPMISGNSVLLLSTSLVLLLFVGSLLYRRKTRTVREGGK